MANNNTVTIVGNLTRDPEMRFTSTGRGQTTLGVAVSRRYQDRNGEWQEESGFYDVVCWGSLADNAGASLRKGTRVMVTGRLQYRTWETDSGDKRSKIEIVADDIGPSLRFATAEVHRVERSGPGEPAAARAAAPAAAGGTDNDEYGEEPF